MASKHPLFLWDCTLKAETSRPDRSIFNLFKQWLNVYAKKWIFQLEKGDDTGYLHYQCKFDLRSKMRGSSLGHLLKDAGLVGYHLSPSHAKHFEYVMKDRTKVDGPWRDEVPLPTKMKVVEDHKHAWQSSLEEMPFDDRKVIFVCDPVGRNGKSTWSQYRCWKHDSILVKQWQHPSQVTQAIFAQLPSDSKYVDNCEIIVDCTRAHLCQQDRKQLASALEGVKDGFIQEFRYKYQRKFLGHTRLIVFSNWRFKISDDLSADRWSCWQITGEATLQPDFIDIDAVPGLQNALESRMSLSSQPDGFYDWRVSDEDQWEI